MYRKTVSGIILAVFLTSILSLAFNIQPAKAGGTITIREDGIVDPETAPIQRVGEFFYMFTGDISWPIVVRRSNITLDGAGYTLQVPVASKGITLASVSNVNVSNTYITQCNYGIYLDSSSGNTLSGNVVTRETTYGIQRGICLYSSSGNTLSGNTATADLYGIWLDYSSDNTLVNNNVAENAREGIHAYSSSNNMFQDNNVSENSETGLYLESSSNKTLFKNNATGNTYNGIKLLDSDTNNLTGNNADGARAFDGIHLERSSDNVLSGNSASENNGDGFYLAYSNNNTLSGNDVIGNNECGIHSEVAHANNISNNTIAANKLYDGVRLSNSTNSTICTNNITANGQHGILLDTYSSGTVCKNNITENLQCGVYLGSNSSSVDGNNITANDIDGVCLHWDSHNTICGNDIIANGRYGVSLDDADNNVIYGNNLTNNTNRGVYVYMQSDNNVICGNNIYNNARGLGGYGVSLISSKDNKLCHNSFMDSPPLVELQASMNTTWDDGYPSGGNYWSNYAGVDLWSGSQQNMAGSDGIGDTPYPVKDNEDRYPLMSTHYVAVDITRFKTAVGQGCIMNINVTVVNRGTYNESVNLRLFANSTLINQTFTTVMTIQPKVNTFTWNTSDCNLHENYNLTACVSAVSGESSFLEHNCTYGYVEVTLAADIWGPDNIPDCEVDMWDVGKIGKVLFSAYPDARYNPNFDINDDGKINMADVGRMSKNFQNHCP